MTSEITSQDHDTPSVGDQELALLRFLAERGGATVGEATDAFGRDQGLARSTVLTMMERLRKKGLLERAKVKGVYRYTSPSSAPELLRGVVERFVERTLGGSVSPFVSYLADTAQVSDAELEELEELVSKLHSRREDEG